MRKQAARPRGWRTTRRINSATTASTITDVTATSSHRIPEKLDQAAP